MTTIIRRYTPIYPKQDGVNSCLLVVLTGGARYDHCNETGGDTSKCGDIAAYAGMVKCSSLDEKRSLDEAAHWVAGSGTKLTYNEARQHFQILESEYRA